MPPPQPTLDDVRQAVRAIVRNSAQDAELRRNATDAPPALPRAAVAAVLRDTPGGGAGVEVLLIRRAEHPLDPWSGHMAFPGGRIDPDDSTPLAAALRETREEVDADLARDAELVGPLSTLRVAGRPGRGGIEIHPFAFTLRGEAALRPNHEVEELVWTPLAFLLDPANRSRLTWHGTGAPLELPCYDLGGRTLWGITLRILDELLDALRLQLAALPSSAPSATAPAPLRTTPQ